MTAIAIESFVALIPACLLLTGSAILIRKARTAPVVLQTIGAACSVLVVLTHVCEALHLLPWMGWGLENSAGHYLDLASAVLAFTSFPLGYLWANVRIARDGR